MDMNTGRRDPRLRTQGNPVHTRVLLTTILVGFLVVTLTGCAALLVAAGVGAGAAGVAYVKGDLESELNANPDEVARAAEQAFEDLGIRKISSGSSTLDAEVVGRTGLDDKVLVKVESQGEGRSKMRIRIGVFGDEMKSRRIHDAIIKRLD